VLRSSTVGSSQRLNRVLLDAVSAVVTVRQTIVLPKGRRCL